MNEHTLKLPLTIAIGENDYYLIDSNNNIIAKNIKTLDHAQSLVHAINCSSEAAEENRRLRKTNAELLKYADMIIDYIDKIRKMDGVANGIKLGMNSIVKGHKERVQTHNVESEV